MPSVRGDDDGTVGYGVFGRSESNKGVAGVTATRHFCFPVGSSRPGGN